LPRRHGDVGHALVQQPGRPDGEHLEGRRPAEDGEHAAARLEPHDRGPVVVDQPGEEGGQTGRLPGVGEPQLPPGRRIGGRHAATASSEPGASSRYCSSSTFSSSVSRRGRPVPRSIGTTTVLARTYVASASLTSYDTVVDEAPILVTQVSIVTGSYR